jgi:hypothetical protein
MCRLEKPNSVERGRQNLETSGSQKYREMHFIRDSMNRVVFRDIQFSKSVFAFVEKADDPVVIDTLADRGATFN